MHMIKANPDFRKVPPDSKDFLNISEFFCDTIQGEGINIGQPATFLRLQGCTQSCTWCDSKSIWQFGNPYTYDELFELMIKADLIRKLKRGCHLVLTGGSPLKQQDSLFRFICKFIEKYEFKPYIEIENECTLFPTSNIISMIDCWNNSPKLSTSGNSKGLRYKPKILKFLSSLQNSWFKFVISKEEDWKEIERDFLSVNLIQKSQVILMPLGSSREELIKNREMVLKIAIGENIRYSSREQINIWDKTVGV